MILLDTHTLIWLDEGSYRLGKKALSLIDQALQSKELFVASISFWEIAMLVEKGRLEMQMDVDIWRQSLIDNGLQEIPLTGNIAIHSTATLCTADKKYFCGNKIYKALMRKNNPGN